MDRHKIVTFGELLLRFSKLDHLRLTQGDMFTSKYGGSEANVAVSLATQGENVTYITRLPDTPVGHAGAMNLAQLGVDTSQILYGGQRIGTYYFEPAAGMRPPKVIYDRSNSAYYDLKPGMIPWQKILKDCSFFHVSGITAAISQQAADATFEALDIADELGVTVCFDINYRKNLWKYGKKASEIMPALVEGCDIILGNEEDADKVFGIKPERFDVTATGGTIDQKRFQSVGERLMERFPKAKKVIITLRGSINANHNTWGGVLLDGRTLYQSPRYDITHIVDRVGGGDSFMGGLIYGLLTYSGDDQKALNFAAAASCLKHTIFGDYNQVTVEEVESLMNGDGSGRVSR